MADIVSKHNVSERSICRWKAMFGGMDGSFAKKLRYLDAENDKQNKQLPETMLKKNALDDFLSNEW